MAECVYLELDTRVDARQPCESVHDTVSVGGGVSFVTCCRYCQRHDYHCEFYPEKAADLCGETTKCLADSERWGLTCAVCH